MLIRVITHQLIEDEIRDVIIYGLIRKNEFPWEAMTRIVNTLSSRKNCSIVSVERLEIEVLE